MSGWKIAGIVAGSLVCGGVAAIVGVFLWLGRNIKL